MQFPPYIVYEILIRLQEINPLIGDYLSFKPVASGVHLRTTTGTLDIPEELLFRQFNEPSTIHTTEIQQLSSQFRLTGASTSK